MTIPAERVGRVTVLKPSGRMTIGSQLDLFRGAVESLIAEGYVEIALDLSRVPFADSAGLGEIIASRRSITDAGGRLVIAAPQGKVRDLLELTRVRTLIDTFDNVDDAVASFDKGPTPI